MATEIEMPALSGSMTEGKLLHWLKSEGESVSIGDVLCEIETDKAVVEVEAPAAGVLAKILVPANSESISVGDVIAILSGEGESLTNTDADSPKEQTKEPIVIIPAAHQAASVSDTVSPATRNARLFASPLARRIARDTGIDLRDIRGSGPAGRIIRTDVEKARLVQEPVAVSQGETALAPKPAKATEYPNNSMRKVIARRLTESKQQVPHFYLKLDVDVDALVSLREKLNERLAEGKLSVNDLIVKAVAQALVRIPECNASWTEAAILRNHDVDISVAVATDSGLITPIVRNADKKGLETLSTEMKELAARAKASKLKPEEYQGGSITISNLGMYGISEFVAIINPPQAAILAVGAVEMRPVVRNGELAVGRQMTCTLSADHRVIDGALGARFLAVLKEIIEDPLRLML